MKLKEFSDMAEELQSSRAPELKRGFTLIELIAVIAISVIIAVVAFVNLTGRRSRADLNSSSQQIATLLREAQSRSASQQSGVIWGVHFDNSVSPGFYALFKSSYSAANTIGRYPLPSDVRFNSASLASGATLDVTFSQISGLPSTSTSVTVELFSGASGTSTVSSISRSSSGKVFFDDFNRTNL